MRQLLLFFCLMMGTQISAQDYPELKKMWMVGGNAEAYIERIGGNTGRFIAIAQPGFGYFVAKNLAVGMRSPMSFFSNEWKIGVAPYVRYYLPVGSHVRPFLEVNGGYSWRGIKDVALNRYSMEHSWLYGGNAGASFFLNPRVSIDLFLFYSGQSSSTRILDTDVFTDPLLKAEMGIGAGFQIFL